MRANQLDTTARQLGRKLDRLNSVQLYARLAQLQAIVRDAGRLRVRPVALMRSIAGTNAAIRAQLVRQLDFERKQLRKGRASIIPVQRKRGWFS